MFMQSGFFTSFALLCFCPSQLATINQKKTFCHLDILEICPSPGTLSKAVLLAVTIITCKI